MDAGHRVLLRHRLVVRNAARAGEGHWTMNARGLVIVTLAVGVARGPRAERPRPSPALSPGGYGVVTADLHTHSSMWSDGALTPWGLVLEAERQGLDAIAVTGHNEVFDAKVARWFSGLVG